MYIQDREKFIKAESVFYKSLMSEIERLAKLVITTCPKVKGFTMAMGSVSFNCKWIEQDDAYPDETFECVAELSPYELRSENNFAGNLDNLIEEWDDKFKLSGSPMMIRRDNVTGELETLNDW